MTHGRARLGGAGPTGTGSHLKTTNQRTGSNQPITNREHSSQSGFVKDRQHRSKGNMGFLFITH